MGQKWGAVENMLGNILRTWWEPIERLKGTYWEPRENEKKFPPRPPPLQTLKEKKARHLECMLWASHWLHEISLPKRVGHHFWPGLIIPFAKNTLPYSGTLSSLGCKVPSRRRLFAKMYLFLVIPQNFWIKKMVYINWSLAKTWNKRQ
jgi:hypothetical protein